MDLESNTAFEQVVDGENQRYRVRITMDTVADPTPHVRMDVAAGHDRLPFGQPNAAIQLSFTRDQMRQHIVQCQKVMGSLPA